MAGQAFGGARGARVFLSSLPGRARPGRAGRREDDGDKATYERDRRLRANLEMSLTPLCQLGLMTVWHDGMVRGGILWEQEVADHLAAAEMILLLLSPQFLASPFCYAQMQQALDRQQAGTLVIPVYLRPIPAWEQFSFGDLTPLPEHGRPISGELDEERAWYEVATALHALLIQRGYRPGGGPTPPQDEAGYRDVVLLRPPLPPAALAPRTALVEAIWQRLVGEEMVTALMLTGVSGAGKTALAALVYDRAETQARTGCGPFAHPPLWLDIRPAVSPRDVVAALGHALGRALPASLHRWPDRALAEELFTLLEAAGRLVIFDQFETWLDVRTGLPCQGYAAVGDWLPLLNAGSHAFSGRVLLTGQSYPQRLLHFVTGCVRECEVPGLTVPEGLELLRQDDALARATDAELAALVEHSQGHALALTALRACLARDAGLRVADLLHHPERADRWVHEVHDQSLETLYRQLQPGERALLRAFAIYRDAVSLEAAQVLVPRRRGAARIEALPAVLLDLHLIQTLEQGRYRLHPAVAGFVRQKSRAPGGAHLHAARYYQQRFHACHLPAEQREASHALLEAAWHFCQAGQREQAYRLVQQGGLFAQLHRRGENSALLALYQELLCGGDWQPEPAVAARVSNELGDLRNALGQKGEALQEYRRALELFEQAGELEGMVEALNNLGAMHQALQAYRPAGEAYQEALRICTQTPRRLAQQGTTLNNLGRLASVQGEQARRAGDRTRAQACFREARSCYEQALAWYRADGLADEESVALNNLGDACRALGESEQARRLYWQALRRFQAQGDRRGEGLALNNLGLLYHELAGQQQTLAYLAEERRCYEQALRLFRETDDRWQERIVLSNLGRLYPSCQALEPEARYRYSLACFLLAGKRARELHRPRDLAVPAWVERTVRHWLAEAGERSYETFVQDIESRAEAIVQEILERKH